MGPRADAVTSLTVETIVLDGGRGHHDFPRGKTGTASLTTHEPGHFWLLLASGVVHGRVPLVFFGASARRLPMTTIGLLQYFAPVLQFIVALVVFREAMTVERWMSFGIAHGFSRCWCSPWPCGRPRESSQAKRLARREARTDT